MHWGRHKENGIWRAPTPRRKLIWRRHDSLFIAFGRTRIRLVKPWRKARP